MKFLNWFSQNIKVVSFVVGIVCVVTGETELGHALIGKGAL